MLTVEEALAAILAETAPFPPTNLPLDDALGLVLAEEVVSDTDSPPFDKALMDGFAVRAADLPDGRATLKLLEEVTAGQVAKQPVGAGECIQIMTGAPMPAGADAVVRVEDTQFDEESRAVRIETGAVAAGTNVMHQGESMRAGERVVPAGRRLRPQELGALAELGRHEVAVHRWARVAVLATGDELVPIDQTPGPGQIRNSNETLLAAQVRRTGAEPMPLGIARDNREHLGERIRAGLECDVLLLSGGVSAGKLDLVPSELEAAGVRQVFHKVRVKPGKPIWFGVLDAAEGRPKRYVFGLPGNPVSSLVCFELFARPAIRKLMGREPAAPQPISARLSEGHLARGDRPTYHPARFEWNESGPVVQTVRWQGSADLRATVEANAMILFPPGEKEYRQGDTVEVILWDAPEYA